MIAITPPIKGFSEHWRLADTKSGKSGNYTNEGKFVNGDKFIDENKAKDMIQTHLLP